MNPYTLQRMPPYDYQAYQMYPYPPFMPIPGRGPRHPYYSNNQGWMNKPYQYNQPTKEDQTQEDENNEAQVPIQLDKDLLSEQKKYPQIVDIGVNLLHPSFRNDLEKVIRRSFSKHVKPLVVTGTSVKSSQNAIALAEKYEGLYTTCGKTYFKNKNNYFSFHNFFKTKKKKVFILMNLLLVIVKLWLLWNL